MQIQPWWLDAVCTDGTWDVALAFDKSDRITGVMPFYQRQRWGLLKSIEPPPLSTYGGPWLEYPLHLTVAERHGFEHQQYAALLSQIPAFHLFRQPFFPDVRNWLAFYWAGYSETTHYTYRLDTTNISLDTYKQGLSSNMRNKLSGAARQFQISESHDISLFYELYKASLKRKGYQPFPFQTVLNLYEALAKRHQVLLLLARSNQGGEPIAMSFIAHDQGHAHLVMSGQIRSTDSGHVNYLMLYELVQRGIAAQWLVDLEGTMDRGLGHSFASMNIPLVPYSVIRKRKFL